jgi:hypothetical protein
MPTSMRPNAVAKQVRFRTDEAMLLVKTFLLVKTLE